MIIEIKKDKVETIQIDRSYKIESSEIKKILKLNKKEEIVGISLFCGRSPNDIENGISADKDVWQIFTREKSQLAKGDKHDN